VNGPPLANYWGGPGPLGPPVIDAPALMHEKPPFSSSTNILFYLGSDTR